MKIATVSQKMICTLQINQLLPGGGSARCRLTNGCPAEVLHVAD
jgi:hypothetical protein